MKIKKSWLETMSDKMFSEELDRISRISGIIVSIAALVWVLCGFIPR